MKYKVLLLILAVIAISCENDSTSDLTPETPTTPGGTSYNLGWSQSGDSIDQQLTIEELSSPKRTVPRSKSFYYSFVDSPYFFYLLIQHGIACSLDHCKLLGLGKSSSSDGSSSSSNRNGNTMLSQNKHEEDIELSM